MDNVFTILHQKQIQIDQAESQSRYSKGAVIAASRRTLKVHGEEAWSVESETVDGKYYKVTEDRVCECADSKYRGEICKHAYAISRRATA
ncbi:MAG TPA: SWIM zinc finger family protein [Nitrososphaeraceae archaeon]|nr:SWIM zinc finger family protein [Nitrososphaeraceae archaeon]